MVRGAESLSQRDRSSATAKAASPDRPVYRGRSLLQSGAPLGRLLVGMGEAQNRRVASGRAAELQANRPARSRKAARNRYRRFSQNIERRRVSNIAGHEIRRAVSIADEFGN